MKTTISKRAAAVKPLRTELDDAPRPLIHVTIPDYDKTFTYSLKMGDLAHFDDNNKLELADRHQLTDLVGVVNNALIALNRAERERAELLQSLKNLHACCQALIVKTESEPVLNDLLADCLPAGWPMLQECTSFASDSLAKATGKE